MPETAYLLINMSQDPTKAEQVQQYVSQIMPLLGRHGGEMISRFQVNQLVEGELAPEFVGVVKFPHVKAAQTAVSSDAYHALAELRSEAFTSLTVMICSEAPT